MIPQDNKLTLTKRNKSFLKYVLHGEAVRHCSYINNLTSLREKGVDAIIAKELIQNFKTE